MTHQRGAPTRKVTVPGSSHFSAHGSRQVSAFPHDALRVMISCFTVFGHLHPHSRWSLLCRSWHCFVCEFLLHTPKANQSSEGFEWNVTHPIAYLDCAIVFQLETLAHSSSSPACLLSGSSRHCVFSAHPDVDCFHLSFSDDQFRPPIPKKSVLLPASLPPDSLLPWKPSFAPCHSLMLTPTAEA